MGIYAAKYVNCRLDKTNVERCLQYRPLSNICSRNGPPVFSHTRFDSELDGISHQRFCTGRRRTYDLSPTNKSNLDLYFLLYLM